MVVFSPWFYISTIFLIDPVGGWGLCREENSKIALLSIGFVFLTAPAERRRWNPRSYRRNTPKSTSVIRLLELALVKKCWWVVENLKFGVEKDCEWLNPRNFWVWEGEGEHGLGGFEKELVKAIDGGGAEFRGMKIKEWKIDEHRVVVAVRFDWFGWLVWLKDPVFSFYYSVIIFFFV
jgi:hypothetical protein